MQRRGHALVVMLTLALCIGTLFLPYFRDGLYLTSNDYKSFSYPVRQFLQDSRAEGRYDFWCPYNYGGHPLYALPLWSPFYPVSMLIGFLPVPDQFMWGAMFHLFVCGLFMYLWLRRNLLPFAASLFGSLLFCFSPFVLVHVNEIDNVMRTIVWIPLIFYAGRVVIDGTEIVGSLLLALALALMILAGHIQFTFYTMVTFVLYYMYSSLRVLQGEHSRQRALKIMGSFGIVITLAVGLSAIGLFPAWYASHLSTRTVIQSWRFITSHSLTPDQLLNIVSPSLWRDWGPTDGTPFLHLGALFPLLLLVPLAGRRGSFPWFCAGMVLLAILIALGKFSPLFVLLAKVVPGFSLFRGPSRFLLIYVFFAATLAAQALPALQERARSFRWLGRLTALYAAAVAAALALLLWYPAAILAPLRRGITLAYRHGYGESRSLAFYLDRLQGGNLAAPRSALLFVLLMLLGFGLLLFLRRRLATARWTALFFLLIVIPYVFDSANFLRFQPVGSYTTSLALVNTLRADRAGRDDFFRVAQYGYLYFNQGTALRLPCLDGYGGIIVMPFGDLVNVVEGLPPGSPPPRTSVAISNLTSPINNLLACAYLISPQPLRGAQLDLLGRDGLFHLYRNRAAWPYLLPLSRMATAEYADAWLTLQTPDFYLPGGPRALLLPPGTARPAGLPEELPPATVTAIPRVFLPDLRQWEISASGPAYINVAENYYPFWQFELDGQPHAAWRGFHFFLATWVPAGRHTLTLRFVPRDLHLGIITTVLSLLVFLLALYWTVKRRLIHNIRDDENVLFDYLEHTSAALALVRSMEGRLFRRSTLPEPVLDIGCGDGLFASIVFSRDIDVGIDLDRVELRKRARPDRYRARANANASALPFASGHFATVISNCVVEHVRDHAGPLREIHRVLRPGGKYVLTTHSHLYGQYLFWYAAFARLGLTRLAQWYADTINRVFKHYTLLTPEEWTALLHAAGFREVTVSFYLSRRAMWLFDLLLPMSLPSRLNKALWGRWAVLPRRFLAACETHLVKHIYREDPAVGAGMCIEARK